MDRKARSGTRGSLPRGRRRCRVYRVLPVRLASKPGRSKSAAFFRNPLTRFNQHPKALPAWENSSVRQAAPCTSRLVTDPGDLVARALEILAEEDEAWRARREPRSHAAEHPVNAPSCGLVNKRPCVFAEAAAKPSPIPACDRFLPAPFLTLQTDEAPATAACMPSRQRARDGSELRWGEADTPVPPAVISPGTPASVTVAVSPVRPGHAVTVEYRVNGGPIRQAIGQPAPRVHGANRRVFRALLPGQSGGTVEFLPVLTLCRPADLSTPSGVRRMSPVSGGLRSGTDRDRWSICRRASLGLGYHIPLGRHGSHP